jgi:breast cancer 2 susceptibility protein
VTERRWPRQVFGLECTALRRLQTWQREFSCFPSFVICHDHTDLRDVAELRSLSPNSAIQYRFHLSPQGRPNANSVHPGLRGPVDAFRELKAIGGNLATQVWVDNHWSLILWKLAGMAVLDLESGLDVSLKRWSWTETMRQLRYRYASYWIFDDTYRVSTHSYEKELNGGARPALRLIIAQDTSAGLHMILCVSGITWSESGTRDDGLPVVPHPTLELTDGWYRLRAQVDEVLARAARRGMIRVGRKIAVSGASVRFRPCFRAGKELIHMT